jgi:hypothetical protein
LIYPDLEISGWFGICLTISFAAAPLTGNTVKLVKLLTTRALKTIKKGKTETEL